MIKKIPPTRSPKMTGFPTGRSLIERLVEEVLRSPVDEPYLRTRIPDPVRDVLRYDTHRTRVVVIGGGTGLSTVVGGDSSSPGWADRPFVGLKEDFPRLDLIVVTTDDGGSTGRLLRDLPLIGIGDLRKSCLSLISLLHLQRTYRLTSRQTREVVGLIQLIFNHRFPEETRGFTLLKNPLLVAPSRLRKICPPRLKATLISIGRYLSPEGEGPTIRPAGHNLGNLLLTAAIFRAAGGRTSRPPGRGAIQRGLDTVARAIGSEPGRLHAATSTPGQLSFRYTNGVEGLGQLKATLARRGFPVKRITTRFSRAPLVSAAVLRALREADLILYAPGSLFSSMIPLLQIRPLVNAIRQNREALKILAANFWVQEGETDISPENEWRGFLASELIEAYERNLPGGVEGLFDVVLSANLDQIPGDILRNYALEGKTPIHLDRQRVEKMGFQSVEATLFPLERLKPTSVIHHDPDNFALTIRTILYARQRLDGFIRKGRKNRSVISRSHEKSTKSESFRIPVPCDYLSSIRDNLKGKKFQPGELKETLVNLAWENRDISPEHLNFFHSARVVSAREWTQIGRRDDLSGYYNTEKASLEIHERLLGHPDRLRSNLLIALGASLLGRAFEEARWIDGPFGPNRVGRGYLVRLRPVRKRLSFLTDRQLRRYLELARMTSDHRKKRVYRTIALDRESFLPPDLLFGLLYAWYLDNSYAPAMDYEMSLLRWSARVLMPFQREDKKRKQALVDFFRMEVFRYPD